MFKILVYLIAWFRKQPFILLLFLLLLSANCASAQAQQVNVAVEANPSAASSSLPSIEVPEEIAPVMIQNAVQIDPLDSPHPVPWNWVLTTHAELSGSNSLGLRYYRSQPLVSPDGQYAAYSRISLQGQPELYKSRVTSVMFLENLQDGDLRTITPSSPLADNPLVSNEAGDMSGTFAILVPVSWSPGSDRLLAREFEGIFNTGDASDYAVIWDRVPNRVSTVAPEGFNYSNAVLLGWSESNPDRVLFRAGELGDENWPVLSVDFSGKTDLAIEDKPIIYGQLVNQVWAGPQARW